MKKFNGLWLSLTLSLLLSCDLTTRTYVVPGSLPVLTTSKITSISQNSAIGGGVITLNGKNETMACGLCWSTHLKPTLDDSIIYELPTTSFTSYFTGLTGSTTYFVRAFAITIDGTSYGDECQFTTEKATPTITDVEGNVYHTVQIGTQLWMAENLKTTKYNDGSDIPTVKKGAARYEFFNLLSPGYCYYYNDKDYNDLTKTYGVLYNGYAVSTGKLAPIGWHVPSFDDWKKLSDYLGGDAVSGGKLKFTKNWRLPNTGATNSSGFSALPGGYYDGVEIGFHGIEYFGHWWSSTEARQNTELNSIALGYEVASTYFAEDFSSHSKNFGFSVRCVKD